MSDNPASDVARRLADEGFGTVTGNTPTITANTYPETPNDIVAVHATTGFDPEETFGGTDQYVYNLSVLVRGSTQSAVATKAMDIWRFLHRFKGVIEGVNVKVIWARSMPFPLGRDENNRWQWSCNYVYRREP